MLGRHIYRVRPEREGWTVTKEGEEKARGRWPQRQAAYDAACALAKNDEPSRVIVENGDGTLGEERAFGIDAGQEVNPA
jgi:hypothetical protein